MHVFPFWKKCNFLEHADKTAYDMNLAPDTCQIQFFRPAQVNASLECNHVRVNFSHQEHPWGWITRGTSSMVYICLSQKTEFKP